MADTGITETQATAIEIVVAILQKELTEQSVLLPTITDYSSWVKKGAYQVAIPKSTSFTAGDKVENTASTSQAVTFSTDDLALSIYKHVFVVLEDRAKEQSAVNVEGEYIQRMASAMVRAIESSVAGVIVKAANDIQLSGTSNLTLTKDDIVEAKQILDEANVPANDRYLAIPPAQEAAMLLIDNFIDASKYGSSDPIQNGEIGRVYGFKVVVSNSFASDTEFSAYHKSHAAFARQQLPKYEKDRNLAKLADELSLSILYGVVQLDSGNRGVYADETATS